MYVKIVTESRFFNFHLARYPVTLPKSSEYKLFCHVFNQHFTYDLGKVIHYFPLALVIVRDVGGIALTAVWCCRSLHPCIGVVGDDFQQCTILSVLEYRDRWR